MLLALLDETPPPRLERRLTVQLYTDEERSQAHRIDDLIVMMHWLVSEHRQGVAS